VVVSVLTGEAEDRCISGYTHGPNKDKGRVVPEESKGRVTEPINPSRAHKTCHSTGE
jgi:hypothetical protein